MLLCRHSPDDVLLHQMASMSHQVTSPGHPAYENVDSKQWHLSNCHHPSKVFQVEVVEFQVR